MVSDPKLTHLAPKRPKNPVRGSLLFSRLTHSRVTQTLRGSLWISETTRSPLRNDPFRPTLLLKSDPRSQVCDYETTPFPCRSDPFFWPFLHAIDPNLRDDSIQMTSLLCDVAHFGRHLCLAVTPRYHNEV